MPLSQSLPTLTCLSVVRLKLLSDDVGMETEFSPILPRLRRLSVLLFCCTAFRYRTNRRRMSLSTTAVPRAPCYVTKHRHTAARCSGCCQVPGPNHATGTFIIA